MKAGISIFLFTIIASVLGLVYFNMATIRKVEIKSNDNIVATIYEHDSETNKTKALSSISYDENNTIYLSKYNVPDIKIESIDNNQVNISRDKKTYTIVDKDKKISKEEHTTLHETIYVNEKIALNIDETDPFGPAPAKPRYSYSLVFTKE